MTQTLLSTRALRPAALGLLCLLAACSSTGNAPQHKGTNTGGGYYKVGKPYQIKGQWYYPKEDYSYDETGIASWYGDDFHQQGTANGETYNKNELTAAHKTLPLPSLARVTNMDNGRSIVVRVNDRGPFSGARIIDVSQRAAQLLGFEQQGTAKVRVQVLADESKAIADAMRMYGGPSQESETIIARNQTANTPAAVDRVSLEPPVQMPKKISEVSPVAEYVQLTPSGKTNIYVQAGAFSNEDNAMRLKHSLAKVGTASVAKAVVNGKQFYRVRLGPIDSVSNADKLLKKVVGTGATTARIVVD